MSESFEETPQKSHPSDGADQTAADMSPVVADADDDEKPATTAARDADETEAAASPVADDGTTPDPHQDPDDVDEHQPRGNTSPGVDDTDDANDEHDESAVNPPANASTQQSQRQAQQGPLAVQPSRNADDEGNSAARQQAGSRASGSGKVPHIAGSIRRAHQPLIAAVSYPPRQEGLTVADFLDPSKPLVKSTVPLTKPKAPSFVDDAALDTRKQHHTEVRMHTAIASSQILAQRNNERKYLKAQYEFEREKKIAERSIYHKERCMQWQQRLSTNPLAVDLVADNERIEEEAYVREKEERHRRAVAERRKQRIKRAIIVKALAEVPLLEKARKEKRELVEGERREKALRDVQRVEAIQRRKLLDQELMLKERQAKLDQRILSGTSSSR